MLFKGKPTIIFERLSTKFIKVALVVDKNQYISWAATIELKEIEAQIFVDGCTLGEVKWQQAELRKLKNRMRANEKRMYHHGNQENPS